jgi:hypothetical protein
MKAFLLKYKRTIILWIVFLFVVLYFAPGQSNYYLDSDIKYFKSRYLIPTLKWIAAVTIVLLLSMLFIQTKSIKRLSLSFLYGTVAVVCFLFIFQDLFFAAALFINRQIKMGSVQKAYVINYLSGMDQTKESFIPFDIVTNQIITDDKLTNKLYQPGIKPNDTVILKFDKGLFGIAFQPKPL